MIKINYKKIFCAKNIQIIVEAIENFHYSEEKSSFIR